MEHNPQLYEKIQSLYEEYWEINSRFQKDSDYYPIIKQLDDILYEHPDNEYALQLKIIVKRSYKRPPKEELKVLCEQLRRINPKNKLASPTKFNLNNRLSKKSLLIFHLISIICAILAFLLTLLGY